MAVARLSIRANLDARAWAPSVLGSSGACARRLGALAGAAFCVAGCEGEILVGADPTAIDAGFQTVTPIIDASTDAGIDASTGAGFDASTGAGIDAAGDAAVDAAALADASGTLMVPWSTGFETGFGDWYQPSGQGYCYVEGSATYAIVTSPVHSGQYAAAFTVNTAAASPAVPSQTRCVRQGVLPPAAYYGAWYYIPAAASSEINWNLLHFQAGDGPDASDLHGLWDVSLTNTTATSVASEAYDFFNMTTLDGGAAIPIAQWFHLEVFLRPSEGGTGTFTLTQNGQVVATISGVETDDAPWGQWYVGNFASALSPSMSTVYVDDVTIGTMPSSP